MNQRDDHTYELISAYLDGELTPDERVRAEQLLAGDESYGTALAELRALGDGMQLLPTYHLGDQFARHVLAHAASLRQPAPNAAPWPAEASNDVQPAAAKQWLSPGQLGWRRTISVAALVAATALVVLFVSNFGRDAGTDSGSTRQIARPDPDTGPASGMQDSAPAQRRAPVATSSETDHQAEANSSHPSENTADQASHPTPDDPSHGQPLHGQPLHGQPLHGQPLHGQPLHGQAAGKETAGAVNRTMPQGPYAPPTKSGRQSTPGDGPGVGGEPGGASGRELVTPHVPQAAVPGAPRQLLLVIDVAVSRGGLDEASFERALLNHGIIFDGTLTADETLENSLLASRFIDSPEEKPKQLAGAEEPPATDRDAMHLVYAVSRGEQVDAVFQTLRENTEHFPLVSLDMAVVPADLDVFHHLRRATEAQWPKQFPAAGADPPRETTHTAAYRLLLSASWRGSPAARLRGTRDLKGLVPDWMLEEAAKLGPARARTDELPGGAPTPAIGAQGRDLVAEVLFVVHAHEPK